MIITSKHEPTSYLYDLDLISIWKNNQNDGLFASIFALLECIVRDYKLQTLRNHNRAQKIYDTIFTSKGDRYNNHSTTTIWAHSVASREPRELVVIERPNDINQKLKKRLGLLLIKYGVMDRFGKLHVNPDKYAELIDSFDENLKFPATCGVSDEEKAISRAECAFYYNSIYFAWEEAKITDVGNEHIIGISEWLEDNLSRGKIHLPAML